MVPGDRSLSLTWRQGVLAPLVDALYELSCTLVLDARGPVTILTGKEGAQMPGWYGDRDLRVRAHELELVEAKNMSLARQFLGVAVEWVRIEDRQ